MGFGSIRRPRRNLLCFFAKVFLSDNWWAIFDSLADTEELIDDLDCLGGLEAAGPTRVEGRSILRDYRYPSRRPA